jgi:hypothetical protein
MSNIPAMPLMNVSTVSPADDSASALSEKVLKASLAAEKRLPVPSTGVVKSPNRGIADLNRAMVALYVLSTEKIGL